MREGKQFFFKHNINPCIVGLKKPSYATNCNHSFLFLVLMTILYDNSFRWCCATHICNENINCTTFIGIV